MFVTGGATVTTAQNLITSADIANGTIKTADLAKGAVNSKKIADGGVARVDLAKGAVNSAKIADGGVARVDLANGAVNSAKIADGGVARADLANGAVNSAKIADGGVARADLANGAVNSAKVADASITSTDIAQGTIQTADISAAAQDALTAVSGEHWGVLDRNVIGNGDAYLRAGPSHAAVLPANPPEVPPLGVGSLGLRTGAGSDKAAFGNEVDFAFTPLSELTAVSFFAYTTSENVAIAADNLPAIAIEIDPNLASAPGDDFATMVYEPDAILPVLWRPVDAVADAGDNWGLSSLAGTPCSAFTSCTFQELMDALDDGGDPALIGTVAITKGSNHAFSGAVDALRINDTVYDFEPNGVFATPAAP